MLDRKRRPVDLDYTGRDGPEAPLESGGSGQTDELGSLTLLGLVTAASGFPFGRAMRVRYCNTTTNRCHSS